MADLTGMMQAAAGAGGGDANFIEDVFSTYLYNGNGATQTITNEIDLSTEGGLVWGKRRNSTGNHFLTDTVRGSNKLLISDSTTSEITSSVTVTGFNTNGFGIGAGDAVDCNNSGGTYVSWTFREQPKFFDVVTYTGTGSNRTVAHALGSVPGCIMVKRTNNTGDWQVYHRANTANPETDYLVLNSTAATADSDTRWNDTAPTSAVFSLGTEATVNASGGTYVAYIFAHDAGGFGLTGTNNVISCGSFTTDGSGIATVSLGYEPQWVMTKNSSGTSAWRMFDTMRGLTVAGQNDALLQANSSAAEIINSDYCSPTATGFEIAGHSGSATHIYIAIRRGPMKVPELGTSVFAPLAVNNATGTVNTTNFPVDLQMQFYRPGGLNPGTSQWIDRLRGFSSTSTDSGTRLYTTGTQAEVATALGTLFNNTGFSTSGSWDSVSMSYNNFRRAPSFFDEVCYTGTGSPGQTITHNLGVAPELIIIKVRSTTGNFWTFTEFTPTERTLLKINLTDAGTVTAYPSVFVSAPTSTSFELADNANFNDSGTTYVAYLFATCAGVSKVGSYTGTAAAQVINCGFTGGARFVLIKRTDSTGDWYVWDSARGIVAGDDPYLLLNSTAGEVTNTDYVDTAATGFELTSTAPAAINASGGTYIFLAIA
jgi:hypothetical protein